MASTNSVEAVLGSIAKDVKAHDKDWVDQLANDPQALKKMVSLMVAATAKSDVQVVVLGGDPAAVVQSTAMGRDVTVKREFDFSRTGKADEADFEKMKDLLKTLADSDSVPVVVRPAEGLEKHISSDNYLGRAKSLGDREFKLVDIQDADELDDLLDELDETRVYGIASDTAAGDVHIKEQKLEAPVSKRADAARASVFGKRAEVKMSETVTRAAEKMSEYSAQEARDKKQADAAAQKKKDVVTRDETKRALRREGVSKEEALQAELKEQRMFDRIEAREVRAEAREDAREQRQTVREDRDENDDRIYGEQTDDLWRDGTGPHKAEK